MASYIGANPVRDSAGKAPRRGRGGELYNNAYLASAPERVPETGGGMTPAAHVSGSIHFSLLLFRRKEVMSAAFGTLGLGERRTRVSRPKGPREGHLSHEKKE